MVKSLRALIVDDEKNIRKTLSVCLEGLGCQVSEAATAELALEAVRGQNYEVIFLDLQLGSRSGLELLPELLAIVPSAQVVMITAFATFETAVEAVKRGATDYIPKPFTPAQIEHLMAHLGREQELRMRVGALESRLHEAMPEIDLETRSPRMRAVLDTATRVASSDVTVLLRGESGTGKGVVAQAIHEMSPRKSGPFVVVNCPSLSEQLIASELFGHVRGAFTGALADRPGRIEAAERGTIFLDEIAELSPDLQAKLLRFLQEKTFERVGDSTPRKADVRIVAATNRDLEAAVKDGRFREDLLFRLNVIEISLPPLRERPEDILPLARRFLAFSARQARRPAPQFSPSTEDLLHRYGWPGNLRELRNAIERAVILSSAPMLEPQALPDRISARSGSGPQIGGPFTLDEIDREHIDRVVESAATLEDAAHILGIDPSTLWRKRKRQEGERARVGPRTPPEP